MKYIFRGNIVFEYIAKDKRVIQHKVDGAIPSFDYCMFISEDYKLLSEFFDRAYKHTNGIEVDLSDIEVY